jgi:phage-related protein
VLQYGRIYLREKANRADTRWVSGEREVQEGRAAVRFTYEFAEVNEKVPMLEFLDELSIRERAKVFASIEKLVELKIAGIPPKENLSKHLEDGIFELRIGFENRIVRSFYFYEAAKQIIFTHGFVKKTEQTPKGEVARAQSIRQRWREQ